MTTNKLDGIIDYLKESISSKKTRIVLYLTVVLWLALATQVAVNHFFAQDFQITQAFVKTDTEDQSSSVEIIAEYEKEFLSENEKNEIIYYIAEAIGLEIDEEITVIREEDRSVFYFEKNAKSADTLIKVISIERPEGDAVKLNHYILVSLNIQKSIHEIERYKDILEKALDKLDVKEKQVTMQYVGNYQGKLSQREQEEIAKLMVKDLQGEIAFEFNEDGVYTVYGYTGLVNEYILSLASKVNIHIVITYDEESDTSKLYLASPIANY